MDNQINDLQKQLKDLQNKFGEVEKAYHDLRQKYIQIDSLYSITSSLSAIVNFEELLKYTKNIFRTTIKANSYSLMLLDEQTTQLKIQNSFGLPLESQKLDNLLLNGTVFKRTIHSRDPVFLPDISQVDPSQLYPGIDSPTGCLVCAPLVLEDRRILGLLNLSRSKPADFTEEEREFITKIAEQLAHTLNKVLIYEHTRELSITDDLTGIFNRRYFNQRFESEIQRAKRYDHSLSIQMLDIDNFKTYNDVNGHIMGDEVLKNVSLILEKILRKTDLIARFGGEEFIIMLPEISKVQSRKVANKLRGEIERTAFGNEVMSPNGKITVSVGLSVFPEDSREPRKLIQFADDALYRAKSMGRNCVVWHDMPMPKTAALKVKSHTPKIAEKPF